MHVPVRSFAAGGSDEEYDYSVDTIIYPPPAAAVGRMAPDFTAAAVG
jgi:hypothetical protein